LRLREATPPTLILHFRGMGKNSHSGLSGTSE
jgi:hypothetical protein